MWAILAYLILSQELLHSLLKLKWDEAISCHYLVFVIHTYTYAFLILTEPIWKNGFCVVLFQILSSIPNCQPSWQPLIKIENMFLIPVILNRIGCSVSNPLSETKYKIIIVCFLCNDFKS